MLGLHLKMYNVPQSRKLHFILIYVLLFGKLFVFNLDIFAVYRANNLSICTHILEHAVCLKSLLFLAQFMNF